MTSSQTSQAPLDERKLAILKAIVDEYIATGVPVGSQTVAQSRKMNVSAATIRNEMKVLESEGYIEQPHTSAGRVPTDSGYRCYVDTLPHDRHLRPSEGAAVEQFFQNAEFEIESLLAETSRLVASVTHHAAVVVTQARRARRFRGAHIDRLASRSVLVSLVYETGEVASRRIDVTEEIDDQQIEAAARTLKAIVVGKTAREGASAMARTLAPAGGREGVAADLLARITEVLEHAQADETPRYYLGGASRTAAAGSFTDPEEIHRVLELLEQQASLIDLMRELIRHRGLAIVIGSENPLDELAGCTVVATSFGVEDVPVGSIGVVGPTRMNYRSVISGVEEISLRLGNLLERGFASPFS